MVDLTNCDREPIHIPGSIQPHGVLLVMTEPELVVMQVSENVIDHIGMRIDEDVLTDRSPLFSIGRQSRRSGRLCREDRRNGRMQSAS